MSQTLPVNGFKWFEDISEFNGCFIKSSNEESNEGLFRQVGVEHPEKLNDLHNSLPLLPERMKSLLLIYKIKLNILFTSMKSWISFEKCSYNH